ACAAIPSIPLHLALFLTRTPATFSSAHWRGLGLLEIRGIQYRDAIQLEALTLQLDPRLLLGRISEIRIDGAEGWLSRLSVPSSSGPGLPLRISRLLIANSVLQLDNLGPGIPPTPLRLGDTTPLLFTDLRLGSRQPSEAAAELQSATVEHLVFYSPTDPLAPVLAFSRIDLAFTWDGLTHHQLQSLHITEPTIYLGDDLFAFVDRIQSHATQPNPTEEPFKIGDFHVEDGRLAVSIYGQPILRLPVHFAAEQKNLEFRDFTEIQLATTFTIPPSDLDYPSYDIALRNLRGNLFFSLGRNSEGKRLDNVVPTLFADQLTYHGLTAEKLSVSVTVDSAGIFGRANAALGGGSLDGGFSLYFKPDLPWSGWSSITGMESRVVTDALTPTSFRLTSHVDALVNISAQGKEIRGGYGTMTFRDGGRLQIPALDDTEQRIPKNWNWIKQGSARAALNLIRNYNFASGEIRAVYQPPGGRLSLNLRGPEGKRDIQLNWLPPGS
ncbi:MAG: hypothetical protein NTZ01_05055, partial [Verrucomicrobia bacterium]|nr:hypothetical protein [Verrucomicrobiota bacterium]